jgi:Tol biopolymer transport system component
MGKLTLEGSQNFAPAWMPGGEAVIFVSNRAPSQQDLYARRADGSAAATLLLHAKGPIAYGFVSPDGQWIVYMTSNSSNRDLYARRVNGDTATITLAAASNIDERAPQLSPDGKWLAYSSTESRQSEVYVSPFPNTSASRTQVSLDGGNEPLWAPNGKELFYLSGTDLVAAKIEAAPPALRVVSRTRLFSRSSYNRNGTIGRMYDVSPDGQRFIMTRKRGTSGQRLVLVLNWFAELAGPGGSK